MLPAQVLPVLPGERVLDLCAAPGGKATALAAKLQGKGLLVANEISASRAKALLKNLEVSGVTNSFVTNTTANRLAEQFPDFFDKVLVDAPCSGEGMFRKDIANARAWSPDKVQSCAKIQREITRYAADMLRPGGLLLYSTCTFAPEEDEGTVAYLLNQRPELELMEIPGCEAFSKGNAGYLNDKAADEAALQEELSKCVRLFPHCCDGEGHFLALFRKKDAREDSEDIHKRGGVVCERCEDAAVLQEFLKDVSAEWDPRRFEVRSGQAYYVPGTAAAGGLGAGLPFLRNGLYLGEIRRGRFEPSQSFAMALKAEEYASVVNFTQDDPRARRYLSGETVQIDDMALKRPAGWQLVCVSGYPLGWGKLVNGMLKNKYHPGWRMQN